MTITGNNNYCHTMIKLGKSLFYIDICSDFRQKSEGHHSDRKPDEDEGNGPRHHSTSDPVTVQASVGASELPEGSSSQQRKSDKTKSSSGRSYDRSERRPSKERSRSKSESQHRSDRRDRDRSSNKDHKKRREDDHKNRHRDSRDSRREDSDRKHRNSSDRKQRDCKYHHLMLYCVALEFYFDRKYLGCHSADTDFEFCF